jgi:galactose mutarotase-like enzyme
MEGNKMNILEQKNKPELKIETVKGPNGNQFSYCLERGNIFSSVILNDKEILYMDDKTLKDKNVNVKGGIPILFPNAGPIPEELKTSELMNLKQHGTARNQEFTGEEIQNGFKGTLTANSETRKVYPYDFKLEIEGVLNKDGSFSLIQTVENLEQNKELPISSGLHPYFKVPSEEKKNIRFNFEGGKVIEEKVEKWANGEYISIENPGGPLAVSIPNLGTLVFEFSKEYKNIWIWSQAGKDFICIEPVMGNVGGIILDPVKIKPSEKNISTMNILLKKEENEN